VDLTNEDVTDILALLDSLPYDSLDLETSQFRLTLRRGADGWTEESQVLAEPTVLVTVPDAVSAPAGSLAPDGPATDGRAADGGDGAADGLAAVKTPLPGTFYRAPRPGADPFVQVGDAVTPGTVVAIVETMKLMNPVHAGTAGRVARISLENGEFAPLGTTLMLIEPA
jgi:acetyl-CoA carboxylase biotin carboxyl carrier protein